MTDYTGRCLCGDIHYRVTAEPVVSRICWCKDCQRIASNGTVNVIFPTDAIEITGTPSEYFSIADSGNQLRRRFCPRCGSHLFADSSGRVGLTVVRVGTLDDPSAITPTVNIWTGSAPRWACLDAALERTERHPPPPQTPPQTPPLQTPPEHGD